SDPWQLLQTYAEAACEQFPPQFPETAPVSWCSWYPYRLSVSEDRLLANARIAVERLKPLGLSIMQTDLGWETQNLPSAFDENERFPHGLSWLAQQLDSLGLKLGVWKAPFTISEFDPVCAEHPEWLICDANGAPLPYWTWFWEPHGKVFILDLTQPEVRDFLRQRIASLKMRGVRYLKADFIGCVTHPLAKNRRDKTIVAGGGLEAARLGASLIREALPDALLLNCGGPEMPGSGHWSLLYTCNDTGNTGFIGYPFQQTNFQAVACHLFKNYRWGILQPSCLCVGLPGSLEEARLRATVAFLAGGQVDISDDLTTLPEDRWEILTATLPPLGISARPIDLFDPICADNSLDYTGTCQGKTDTGQKPVELPAGSVWQVHVQSEWDEWDLIGLFSFSKGTSAPKPEITRFSIPLARLSLSQEETYTAFEFWSGQYLDAVPGSRKNLSGYTHPGDYQELKVGGEPNSLQVAFFGPGIKLLCVRKARPHPWVVGTSFHQSCGTELQQVTWDAASGTLSGELHRPRGESGVIVIAPADYELIDVMVQQHKAQVRPGANGSLTIPITCANSATPWRARFQQVLK
ncbi:alpha-galactosidase, partial [candidate division KSB1 bacterium]|nr:alpha-galactosidase [candidate division KSB1 bacterium]